MREDKTESTFFESLSDRELEILAELQRGVSDRQIAQTLHLSVNTIKWYNRQIYSKLGVSGREEAAELAEARGLLVAEAEEGDFQRKATAHNLPAIDLPAFIGRERDIGQIQSFLRRKQLVTLTGPGGVGKTRLALQIAAGSLEEYPDGVYLVELASVSEPEMVVSSIASTLGVKERSGVDLQNSLIKFLSGRRMLLVMDNFEHVLTAAAELAGLFAGASQLTILATSRERLGLSGEQVYPLEPLRSSEAVALFYQRARAIEPDFDPEKQQASTIDEICQVVDRLPLAIELAAGRISLLPPQAIRERLANSFDALVSMDRDRPDRHQTLLATVDWSYQLLEDDEQKLFRTLGYFPGGGQLDTLEAIGTEDLAGDLLDLLQALLNKSLLWQKPNALGEPRFGMLDTIRAYALTLGSANEQMLSRLADFYLDLTSETTSIVRGPQIPARRHRARIESEFPNLHFTFERLLADREIVRALKLFINLRYYFWAINPSQGLHWTRKALEVGSKAPVRIYAQALAVSADLYYIGGNIGRSRQLGRQALKLMQENEADIVRADLLRILGSVESQQGNFSEAEEYLREAAALYEQIGSRYDVSIIQNSLGELMRMKGDMERSRAYYEDSLRLRTETQDNPLVSAVLLNLATISRQTQESSAGLKYALDALINSKERHIPPVICASIENLAGILLDQDPLRSARWFAAAAVTRNEIGSAIEPVDRSLYDQDLDRLKGMLDNDSFAEAWLEGEKLELGQVMDQVIEVSSKALEAMDDIHS